MVAAVLTALLVSVESGLGVESDFYRKLSANSWKVNYFSASFTGKEGKCILGEWNYKSYDQLVR